MQNFDCPHCHKIFDAEVGVDETVFCPHCNGAVSLPEKDLPPGTMVGGYEIVNLIGHGGMGNVYLANQISMRRLVALKILLKSLTEDKEAVEQFLNEARISGQLNHRNIITALDAGEYDGTYFLATAYVDGEDLEKRLALGHVIPEGEALSIIFKIGAALRYAWENHGMLHKDIKPGNIIVNSLGEPFLMDMGIAQFIGDHQKKEEHVFGSPFYMSPEQTTGSSLYWTSDLYSLGATLYHMVVGLPPYDAPEVMEIIEMHSSAPFPEPMERNPNVQVSRATTELLRRMLAKKPPQRHCSWQEFLDEVEAALHGRPYSGHAAAPAKRKTGKSSRAAKTARKGVGKRGVVGKRTRPTSKRTSKRGVKRGAAAGQEATPGDAVTVPKKDNSATVALMVAGLLALSAIIGAFVYVSASNEETAKKALASAERYLASHPGMYSSAISKFQSALADARGTSLESTAQERLQAVRQESASQQQLIDTYNASKIRVRKLVDAKKYTEAINLVNSLVGGIKDPALRKQSQMTIMAIKVKMQEKKASR